MELRQLRYFVEVARLQSFSQAASTLSVAQPALSRQIAALEDDLGLRLFVRNGRGVALTCDGETLLQRAAPLVETFDALQADMRDLGKKADLGGEVRVGIPAQISQILSARLLREARSLYPRISLRVIEGYSGLMPESLKSGALDLAILFGGLADAAIASEDLAREEIGLIGAQPFPDGSDSIDLRAALNHLTLILPYKPHPVWANLARADLNPPHVLEAVTLPAMRSMIENGEGLLLQSPVSFIDDIRAGRLHAVAVRNPSLEQTVLLCHLANRRPQGPVAAIAEVIRTLTQSLVESGAWPRTVALI